MLLNSLVVKVKTTGGIMLNACMRCSEVDKLSDICHGRQLS